MAERSRIRLLSLTRSGSSKALYPAYVNECYQYEYLRSIWSVFLSIKKCRDAWNFSSKRFTCDGTFVFFPCALLTFFVFLFYCFFVVAIVTLLCFSSGLIVCLYSHSSFVFLFGFASIRDNRIHLDRFKSFLIRSRRFKWFVNRSQDSIVVKIYCFFLVLILFTFFILFSFYFLLLLFYSFDDIP